MGVPQQLAGIDILMFHVPLLLIGPRVRETYGGRSSIVGTQVDIVPTIAGLLCGACRIPLRAYLAGSCIGFIPLPVVFSAFGKGSASGDFRTVVFGTMLLAATVCVRMVLIKVSPGRTRPPV